MAQLYLPAEHTEADLVVAGLIAQLIDSAELHVAWSSEYGQSAPTVAAFLREPAAEPAPRRGLVRRALAALLRGRSGRRRAPSLPPAHVAAPRAGRSAAGEAPA